MNKTAIFVLIVLIWFSPCLADEKIFTWTDENGVKRFGDRPPDDIKHYDTIKIPQDKSGYVKPAEGSRPEYDQMIENIRQEKQLTEEERIKAEADRAAKEKLDAETRKKERIEAELKSLQEQVDNLKKRPIGRAFSLNVKNARIGEIEKQINLLKNSPDEYFRNR